jgi:S1-C subfamily serine protease
MNKKTWRDTTVSLGCLLAVVIVLMMGLIYQDVRNPARLLDEVVVLEAYVKGPIYYNYNLETGEYEKSGGLSKAWMGSGVIVDDSGIILTAKHCLEGADEIKIILLDGTEFITEEMYWADDADIGVCIIDPNGHDLDVARFDTSVRIGDRLRLIGHPYGELWSVTEGIISFMCRQIPFFGDKLMFQIDAPSNPGNSGGPAYDMDGEVIGILNGGYRGAEGLHYITPSKACVKFLDYIKELLEYKAIE